MKRCYNSTFDLLTLRKEADQPIRADHDDHQKSIAFLHEYSTRSSICQIKWEETYLYVWFQVLNLIINLPSQYIHNKNESYCKNQYLTETCHFSLLLIVGRVQGWSISFYKGAISNISIEDYKALFLRIRFLNPNKLSTLEAIYLKPLFPVQ